MRKFLSVPVLVALALVSVLSATPPQLPVLGQPLPAASGQSVTARHQLLQQAGAVVREYQTPRGVTVRAFASASGVVFGLAWHGIVSPDLTTLLGSNYTAYRQAASAHRHRGPLTVHAGNLVVQLSGHMRDLHGRAYLTSAIPAQLSAAVVH